jgi:phage gp36-like protein
MPIELDPVNASPAGHYADLQDLYDVAGERNVLDYSDLDGDVTLDTARIQTALDDADRNINVALKMAGLAQPVASTADFFDLLRESAAYMAVAWLYTGRGQRDVSADEQSQADYKSKAAGWAKVSQGLLAKYITHRRQQLSTATNMQFSIGER